MKPIQVNSKNQIEAFNNIVSKDPVQAMEKPIYQFKVGNAVKILDKRSLYDRIYVQKWTSEIFYIESRFLRQAIPIYKLKDENGEQIQGSFYENELFKVPLVNDKVYTIEKILKRKRINNIPHVLVKWMNYPKSFNSWIPTSEVKNLK